MEQKKVIKISLKKAIILSTIALIAIIGTALAINYLINKSQDIIVKSSKIDYANYKDVKFDDSFMTEDYIIVKDYVQYTSLINNIKEVSKNVKIPYKRGLSWVRDDMTEKYKEIIEEFNNHNCNEKYFEEYNLLLVRNRVHGWSSLKSVFIKNKKLNIKIKEETGNFAGSTDLYFITLKKEDVDSTNSVKLNVTSKPANDYIYINSLLVIPFVLFFLMLVAGVIYDLTLAKKIKKEDLSEEEKKKLKKKRNNLAIIAIVVIIPLLMIFCMIYYRFKSSVRKTNNLFIPNTRRRS